jgi:hypothetical protein
VRSGAGDDALLAEAEEAALVAEAMGKVAPPPPATRFAPKATRRPPPRPGPRGQGRLFG